MTTLAAVAALVLSLSACPGSDSSDQTSGHSEKSGEAGSEKQGRRSGKQAKGSGATQPTGDGSVEAASGPSEGSVANTPTTLPAKNRPVDGSGGTDGEQGQTPASGPARSGIVTSVTPACVEDVGTVKVIIKAAPIADVAYAAAFSDDEAYGNYGLGISNDKGVFIWNVQVPPQAPEGAVELIVTAVQQGRPSEEAQKGEGSFVVAGLGEC